MDQPDSAISHVSDTALMVAACRALETARPSGLIRDPFAERLAGARGMAIAKDFQVLELMCFGIAVRTWFLDQLIVDAIAAHSLPTVVSVGSGLDARPWRLDLPAGLRWMEVDFQEMLDYKAGLLDSDRPSCRVERMPADLTDAAQRAAMFAAAGHAPALMITEGLLMYLPASAIESLAVESGRDSGIRHWLLDVTSAAFSRRIHMGSYQSIENVRSEGHADAEVILGLIERAGWTRRIHRSYNSDVRAIPPARLQDLLSHLPPMPAAPPPLVDDPSGIHLFGR